MRLILSPPVLLVCLAIAMVDSADAQSAFELDGNAMPEGVATTEDWAILHDGGAETGGQSIAYTGIVADPGQNTIFGGKAKDIEDISAWRWKQTGGFPDKNDITNAYAAAYTDAATGDLIVNFGADRYANSGDAFLGFWFFKDRVQLNDDGTFSGNHRVGDVLVLVNYPQGSSPPEVQVIQWNPDMEDVAENLRMLYSGAAALCGSVPPADACAITNTVETLSPWDYQPKAGTTNVFPPESFFEGAINVSKILGGTACFSTFLAETRSSTSISSTLKDFVLGEFPVCDIAVEKTCDVVSLANDGLFEVEFSGTVTNTGGGTFPAGSLVRVIDDAGTPQFATDDVAIDTTLSEPLPPGAQVPFSGSFLSDMNPPYNTIGAVIYFGVDSVVSDPYGTICGSLDLNPGLSLSKQCSLALESVGGMVVLRVDFTGQVENTGDVPMVVVVDDAQAGIVVDDAMLNPGDTASFSGSYYPVEANGGETDPGLALFSGSITAVGTSPVIDPVVEMITATCSLCPSGSSSLSGGGSLSTSPRGIR